MLETQLPRRMLLHKYRSISNLGEPGDASQGIRAGTSRARIKGDDVVVRPHRTPETQDPARLG